MFVRLRCRRFLVLALVFAAVSALGQQHPNVERGLQPDRSYEASEVDTVNLFNGVVNVAVPLGGRYHVNGDLSYQFVLSYATNSWETIEHQVTVVIEIAPGDSRERQITRRWSYPARGTNAGFGWRLSFGELVLSGPGTEPLHTAYRSPDGALHVFYETLHRNNPSEVPYQGTNPEWVRYTRDGTYLRLRKIGHTNPALVTYQLDLPNGHIHVFDAEGKLTAMNDRYGNQVTITYGTRTGAHAGSPQWLISDSTGRTHEVFFRPGVSYAEYLSPDPVPHYIIDFVRLATFGGTHSDYTFRYANDTGSGPPESTLTRRHVRNPEPEAGSVTAVSLLEGLDLPFASEQLSYEFTYVDDELASGNLQTLRLPTGANIEYEYISYEFPTDVWDSVGGIFSRRVMTGAGSGSAMLSLTEYVTDPYIDPTSLEVYANSAVRRIVRRKDKAETVLSETRHYFTTCKTLCPNENEYGLPLTRYGMPAGGPFLSTETLEPAEEGGTPVVKRSTYVMYEAEADLDGTPIYGTAINRRQRYSKTVFEDGTFKEQTFSNFDGLGNYRQITTGGTNPYGENVVTTVTNYNPGVADFQVDGDGNLVGAYTMRAVTSPWILGVYDKQQVTQGSQTSTVATCFDANGFQTRKRTYAAFGASPALQGKDVLVVYTPDSSGNLMREQYLGGDAPDAIQAPTGTTGNPTCQSAITGENVRIEHRYASGSRSRSYFMNANGPMSHFLLDVDIDAHTGLVKKRRVASVVLTNGTSDGQGLGTELTYDALGRLILEKPVINGDRGAVSRVAFSNGATIVNITEETATGTVLRSRKLELDVLGRATKETRAMPGGVSASRTWEYDALGRITAVSVWGRPDAKTLYEYDFLDRLRKVTAPDQKSTTFTYSGVKAVESASEVQTSASSTSTAVQRSEYDGQGRLKRVIDPSQVVTRYDYDVAGRLTRVCGGENGTACGQQRIFTYDNRGFLTAEQMPELGVNGNGTATYRYDDRGNVIQKTVGSGLAAVDVMWKYDRAGRLLRVHEAQTVDGVQRNLKWFEYGTGNGTDDFRNGQMTGAIRYNWFPDFGFGVQVVEDYTYGGRDGRVSERQTSDYECATAGGAETSACNEPRTGVVKRNFVQTFTYDELGSVETIGQPKCTVGDCAAANLPDRTVTNTYDKGWLTQVSWTGTPPSSIAYDVNGMVKKVAHVNGVVDETLVGLSGLPRPELITVSNMVDPSSCVAPTFSIQPAPTTIASGSSTVLSARAEGQSGQGITYQWYRGAAPNTGTPLGAGTLINGVTQLATGTLTSTTSFWVKATNACPGGTAASQTAVVTVCVPPSISAQPQNVTITRSQTTLLKVTASGTGPLHYQWYIVPGSGPWTPIEGATSNELNVTPTDRTSYAVKVSNACDEVTSSAATVTVQNPPGVPQVSLATNGSANTITWTSSSSLVGIGYYEVQRRDGPVFHVTMPATRQRIDGPSGVTPGAAYLYRVRAVDLNGVPGAWSPYRLVTTMTFTDTLQAGGPVRGVHVAELRKAIDAVRVAAGFPAAWPGTYAPLTGAIRAAHVMEMRLLLNDARGQLGLPPLTFTNSALTSGSLGPKVVHLNQLRNGLNGVN